MTETMVRRSGFRRNIALGAADLAVVLTLLFSRLYPSSLAGEWDQPLDEKSHQPLLLTLRSGGSGYIKAANLPEETLR